MSRLALTPEQQAEADRITERLMKAAAEEVRGVAELLDSRPDNQLLGRTEFEVRDRVHEIGAKAIETALNGRKEGAIKGPARAVRGVRDRGSSRTVATRPSSA